MVARAFKDLSTWQRRRLVLVATVRTIATTALVVAIYYLVPLNRRGDAVTGAELALAGVALAVIVGWQIWQIIRSERPVAQAVEAIAFTVPLYILLFATTYLHMARAQPAAFDTPLTRTDAMYFSTTVFTTVGFGDITARTQAARVAVTLQMVLNLVFLGLVVRLITNAAKLGRQHHP
ncbi:potassium channel family protein [Streptomyces sp. NPDC086182]|uniref:potassium channel family protein n=1 Tax=Streptomyces sp. NPDC086182 TaxID=3155058 RepID=UPI00344407EB